MYQASNQEKKPFHDRAEDLRKEYIEKLDAFHKLQREEAMAKCAQQNTLMQQQQQQQQQYRVAMQQQLEKQRLQASVSCSSWNSVQAVPGAGSNNDRGSTSVLDSLPAPTMDNSRYRRPLPTAAGNGESTLHTWFSCSGTFSFERYRSHVSGGAGVVAASGAHTAAQVRAAIVCRYKWCAWPLES